MYVEIASRGKQIVSKEVLKNWHHFWVSICVFGGPNFGPPNSIEPCFGTATEMAPHRFQKWGCVAGPFLAPHFVNNLA